MSVPDELAVCSFQRPTPGCIVVSLSGELDACSTPRVEEQVLGELAPGDHQIILDLTDIAFIDSTGIRMVMLVVARKRQGDEVVIVAPSQHSPRRTLDIIGLSRFVPVVATLADALVSGE